MKAAVFHAPGRYLLREVATPPLRWVSTVDLARDAGIIAGQLPPGVSGIVGVPRSGMIPAAVIATQLQLPLWELAESGLRRMGNGSRGYNLGFAGAAEGPLVVVDDTVYSGAAMDRARQQIGGRRAFFAAVYVRPDLRYAVDYYARELHSPHLLEWNWANNGPLTGAAANPIYGAGIATDFDGILCQNPIVSEDDEEGYCCWLSAAVPYMLPRSNPVPLIVTGRLERWRAETEEWLRKWSVKWSRLVMYPAATAAERDQGGFVERIAAFKAREFAASGCGFFMESEPEQAELIFQQVGKPVICPRIGRVFQ